VPVDFFYKGLREEEHFYPYTPEQSAAKAKRTLYEAWFDLLKASPWYQAAMNAHVFESQAVADCYEKFGDLRNVEFEDWWLQTGYQIFAERVRYEDLKAHKLDAKTSLKFSRNRNTAPKLVIEVPLNLDPRRLKEQFDEILQKHSDLYDTKFNRWNHSQADVHFERDAKIDYQTIKHWLSVYEYVNEKRKSFGDGYPLYKVCRELKLSPYIEKNYSTSVALDAEGKVYASNVVSDILKKITPLMAHASEMRFPCTEDHSFLNVKKRGKRTEE
jgi:hypothetical protein